MSHQVLARKWRPKSFNEMVGQQHVLKALVNALDHNRLHHAYLFTGTRGVGKTTIARIFAKCLNCEAGVSSHPCGQCSNCLEIDQGNFLDLIEVDAASRTGVDDTRELLENVPYAPTKGRFKVYLIDEIHMFSKSAFNALLKTLEEPPAHVKFLLATTDPQKLPVTVLSRCLQFNLKAMPANSIATYLAEILQKEMVSFEEESLQLLARSADGSMRDALSLTDQAIAHGNEKLTTSDVRSMLGSIDKAHVEALLTALINKDANQLLQEVEKLSLDAPDYKAVLADLISAFHKISVHQVVETSDEFAAKFTAEEIQFFYQAALIGRRDLGLAPDPRLGFEMTLLRMMVFSPQSLIQNSNISGQKTAGQNRQTGGAAGAAVVNKAPIANLREGLEKKKTEVSVRPAPTQTPVQAPNPQNEPQSRPQAKPEPQLVETPEANRAQPTQAQQPAPSTETHSIPADTGQTNLVSHGQAASQATKEFDEKEAEVEAVASNQNLSYEYSEIKDRWTQVVLGLDLQGAPLSLAKNSNFKKLGDGAAALILDPQFEMLATEQTRTKLKAALDGFFKSNLALEIKFEVPEKQTPEQNFQAMDAAKAKFAKQTILEDDKAQKLMNQFSAEIIDDSVKLM